MTKETGVHDRGTEFGRRDYLKAIGAAGAASALGTAGTGTAAAAPSVVSVGNGGYADGVPSGVSASPDTPDYATSNVSAPYPTNDWWSRLLSTEHAETLFSHPIFTEPTSSGLEIGYTDEWEIGTGNGVNLANETDEHGAELAPYVDMQDTVYKPFDHDFTIGHTATSSFDQSLVDGFGDWHVTYQMGSVDPSMTVTQVQGSPYLYLDYAGGGTELTFTSAPTVFEDRGDALGVSIDGHHYALFGPEGTSWSGQGSATLTNDLGTAGYVTIALLPDATSSTLDTFESYAHHQVTDTQIDWEYVNVENGELVSEVRTTFSFTVDDRSGSGGTGTIAALYPHQHKYLADGESTIAGMSYESARGTMECSQGSSFTTALTYPGILPNFPLVDSLNSDQLNQYAVGLSTPDTSLDQFDGSLADKYGVPTLSETSVVDYTRLPYNAGKSAPFGSTYWTGLNYNRWSEAAALLNELGETSRRDLVLEFMQGSYEQWFTPKGDLDAGPDEFDTNMFFYDNTWGTLVGHVGGFNTYAELNDHHFHYGYYVKGASEIARYGSSWTDEANWGGMIKLLIREFANPTRGDDTFPFLRNFSPYAGHSFASGTNPFHLGNNQEASSEAIDAYAGLIRWGAFTGQQLDGTSIRDLGIFLYTHEIHAALEYWYDWDQENHPDDWTREYASVVWGDGYSHSTWWTEDDEDAYAINVIPANGDSLYLGWDQNHAGTVYDELVSLKGSEEFTKWPGILTEFQGFGDPAGALTRMDSWESGNFPNTSGYYVPDMSNSKLHTYSLLGTLDTYGSPTRDVVSDATFSHVFVDDGGQKNYIAYNEQDSERLISFSDGTGVTVPANSMAIQEGANDNGDVGGSEDTTPPSAPTNLASTGTTESSVSLSWNAASDSGTGVDHYDVSVGGTVDHTVAAGTTSTTVTGLSAATTYDFSVSAVDGAGNVSSSSGVMSVQTDSGTDPSPWSNTDVGAVDVAGSTSVSGGTRTIEGAGADIWGSADEFHFVYQEVSGDATVTANVTSVESTHAWAKAGVMIRDSLDAGSTHASSFVTPSSGTAFQRRTAASGSTAHTGGSSTSGSNWVRIERSGDTLTASESGDGSSWTEIGSATIAMSDSVYVGLAVTSHAAGTLCTTTVENATVDTGSTDSTPPAAPSSLTATGHTDTSASLSWTESSSSDVDHYNVYESGTKVTEATGGSTTVTGLPSASAASFTVSAVDGAGNESGTTSAVRVYTDANAQDYTQSTSESDSSTLAVSFTPTDASAAVDLTYAINGGAQQTTAMGDGNADGTWTTSVSGLGGGDAVDYHFTFEKNSHDYDTGSFSVTFGGDTTPPSAPTSLSSPAQTTTSLDVAWSASSDAGTGVDHYDVYLNGSIQTSVSSTSTTLSGLSSGTSYDVYVVAVDVAGNASDPSSTQTFQTDTDSSGQSAYNGPHTIPGTIEAEDFDQGGSGVAYSDTTAGNSGGAYRSTDVDLGGNGSGGTAVGWTAAGEWLEYTASVDADGTYDLIASTASSGGGGEFHLEVDGTDVTGPVTVGDTGGWDAFTEQTVSGISLSAGEHVFRLVVDSAGFDVDYLEFASAQDTTPPTAPANLSAPSAGTNSVDLSWDAASDSGTGVDHYNVYEGSTKQTEVTGTSTTLSGLSADTQYTFTVRAVDAAGNESADSNSVTVTTDSASTQSAFNGPHSVPGTIQAEDFDTGGEGVAFHDTTTANDGGAAYRSTAVDIESATSGGYNICWTDTDEWWEYTVQVESAGTYDLGVRVASDLGGGSFHVEVDGTDVTGTVSFAATGGWQAWTTVSAGSIDLSAGEHVIRLYSHANDWNINWLEFTESGSTGSGTNFSGSSGSGWSATVTNTGTDAYEFAFTPSNAAGWADVHFAESGTDAWVGYGMTDSDGDGTFLYTRDSSSDGSSIDFRFVYDDGSGGQYVSDRRTFTY